MQGSYHLESLYTRAFRARDHWNLKYVTSQKKNWRPNPFALQGQGNMNGRKTYVESYMAKKNNVLWSTGSHQAHLQNLTFFHVPCQCNVMCACCFRAPSNVFNVFVVVVLM